MVGIIIIVLLLVVISESLPDLIEAISQLGDFLVLVIRVAVVTIAKITWFLTKPLLRLTWRGLCFCAVFLCFFMIELLRGARSADDEEPEEPAEEPEDEDEEELFAAARTLLGLPEEFSRASLDAAYKRAIRKAHPDAGGSVDAAQAVNIARELLLRRLATS
jgi:hypothetical protein